GNDVRPGAQNLAELDEGGSKRFQGGPQPGASGLLRRSRRHEAAAKGDKVLEVQLRQDIVEAVTQQDLHDLPIAAQVAVTPLHEAERHKPSPPSGRERGWPHPACVPPAPSIATRRGCSPSWTSKCRPASRPTAPRQNPARCYRQTQTR